MEVDVLDEASGKWLPGTIADVKRPNAKDVRLKM